MQGRRASHRDSQLARLSITSASQSADPVEILPPDPDSPAQSEKQKLSYRQFEEFLVSYKGQAESCATLPFTLLFWITFAILAWLHGDVSNIYETRRCLSSVVEDIQVVARAGTPHERNVSFGTIGSKDDIWEWMSQGFVPALGGSGPDGSAHGFVRTYNKLVGSVRLTQRRSTPMDCKVIEDLRKFGGESKCHSGDFSTETYGNSVGDMAYTAGSGLSNGDANSFYAWLDPRPLNTNDAQNRCRSLWQNGWLDRASHDLFVQAAFFNPEVQTFALLEIKFEFRKGGLIRQRMDLRPLSANLYPAWYYYIPDVLWVLWLFLLFQKETRQLYDSCRQGSEERKEYTHDPWNLLDWTSIILGMCIAVFFWFLTSGIETFKVSVGGLSDLTDPFSSFSQDPAQSDYSDALAWNERMNEIHDSFNILVMMKTYHRIAMFWYTVILMARFFKGFRGQPRIAVISKTLALASMDLVHYYYILATVFVNFSLGGYVLFGAQLHAWSTIQNSCMSAFAMTFGKVDYESLHAIAPILAGVWFWSYIIIVVFILFRILTSLIVGHYAEVRSSLGEVGQSIWVQGKWLSQDTWWHYSYEFRHLHRTAVSKMKPKWRRRLSRFAEEVERNPIPMNAMFRAVTPNAEEYIRKSMPVVKFDRKSSGGEQAMKEVTLDLLMECGCDSVTAEHLLMAAKRYQSSKVDMFNPMDTLMKHVDDEMMERYQHLAELEARILDTTDGAWEGVAIIQDTHAKCIQAVKQITPAEEEPPGKPISGSVFRELEDESGQSYYYNPTTGESQWEHPLGKSQSRNRLALPTSESPAHRLSGAANIFGSVALEVLKKPAKPPDQSSSSAAAAQGGE